MFNKGYALLEILVALFITGIILAIGFQYQAQAVKKSAQQFEQLWAINQLRNLLERFRANPSAQEWEFKEWLLENQQLIPDSQGSYHCTALDECEVVLECEQGKFKLAAML